MATKEKFLETVQKGYTFKGGTIPIGSAVFNGEVLKEAVVSIPLSTLNRHGLIAGATGTGKTKTLQGIAEGLASNGVSVMMMDVKGDLSGIAMPGNPHPKISERHEKLGVTWKPQAFPCELMSLSSEK